MTMMMMMPHTRTAAAVSDNGTLQGEAQRGGLGVGGVLARDVNGVRPGWQGRYTALIKEGAYGLL